MGLVTHQSAHVKGTLSLGGRSPDLVIASGVVTMIDSYNNVDTEGAASSDDITSILGGEGGDVIIIQTTNAARDVILKDASGNMFLQGSSDFTHDTAGDKSMLMFRNTAWHSMGHSNIGS